MGTVLLPAQYGLTANVLMFSPHSVMVIGELPEKFQEKNRIRWEAVSPEA